MIMNLFRNLMFGASMYEEHTACKDRIDLLHNLTLYRYSATHYQITKKIAPVEHLWVISLKRSKANNNFCLASNQNLLLPVPPLVSACLESRRSSADLSSLSEYRSHVYSTMKISHRRIVLKSCLRTASEPYCRSIRAGGHDSLSHQVKPMHPCQQKSYWDRMSELAGVLPLGSDM